MGGKKEMGRWGRGRRTGTEVGIGAVVELRVEDVLVAGGAVGVRGWVQGASWEGLRHEFEWLGGISFHTFSQSRGVEKARWDVLCIDNKEAITAVVQTVSDRGRMEDAPWKMLLALCGGAARIATEV